jgi:hypothetical protein
MYNISVIVNGHELALGGGNPFVLEGESGLGMAQVRRLAEAGPLQHGITDLGFRLTPRIVDLVLGVYPNTTPEMWTHRDEILRYLAPYQDIVLKVSLSSGDTRCLDCHFANDLIMASRDRNGFAQRIGLSLRAGDPTFYDPELKTVSFLLGGGGAAFVVPMVVPHTVGATSIDQSVAFNYIGTWISHPQIRIVGPLNDPVIYQQTTGEKLDFTGSSIANGEYWDIDTRYGRKTVTDNSGTNQIAALSNDSDLATFHIAIVGTDGVARGNSIRVTGAAATSNSSVVVRYYDRFLGV